LGRRRSCANLAYDAQGRPYAAQSYFVNPSNGTVTTTNNSLATNFWYDRRGERIKTSQPGGLVQKTKYDGAGRPVAQYTSDGGGDSTWGDAATLTNDYVLEQTDTEYDMYSNPIFVTGRQRFHDASGTGVLGSPGTAPYARVSYTALYYDLADRLTEAL